MNDARKTSRSDDVALDIELKGKKYSVHNICVDGLGFFLKDPSDMVIGEELTPVTLHLETGPVQLTAKIIHVTPIYHLRSNLPSEYDEYLCGIQFIFHDETARHTLEKFLAKHI